MPDLTVAVAQPAGVSQDLGVSIRTHVRLACHAAEHGAQLVLFPELSLTGYHLGFNRQDAVDVSDPRLQPLQAIADSHHVMVVAGAPIVSSRGLHIGTMCFAPQSGVTTYLKEYLGGSEVVAFAICADITRPEHAALAAQGGATIYAASCLLGCAPALGEALVVATKSSGGWAGTVVM